MKQVKIVKTKTAVIILSIVVLFLMIAIFIFFDTTYQGIKENYPQLSVYYKDKEIGKMVVARANWLYKGEEKNIDLGNIYEYDFPEENIVLVANNDIENYVMKSDFRYKTLYHSKHMRVTDTTGGSNGGGTGDFSKFLKKGTGMEFTNGIGECVFILELGYLQGRVDYAVKLVSFDGEEAKIAKNYMNTSKDDNDKIEELIKSIRYGKNFNSCKVDGNNLTLEYDFHIKELDNENLKMNNLVLFACIPELESITYSPKNKKTYYNDVRDEEFFEVQEEVEKRVYTREQVNSENLANIDNLKKFIEQI